MIDPEDRYLGDPDIPTTQCFCDVWDWDQLRMIKIKGTAKIFPPEENRKLEIEDDTRHAGHIPFSLCDSIVTCPTIKLSEIQSLDRLGPGVDLVLIPSENKKVVFEFNPLELSPRPEIAWKEVNILSKLPPHPNLIPFDRIVLEDIESRVIGFTTKYIPCQPLSITSDRPFRLEWLQQLTQLVDLPNLDLGIMHQDIAPRTYLLIQRQTRSSYLILTGPPTIPHWEKSIDMVQNIGWECHCELDHDVSVFRAFLNEWIATRSDKEKDMERFLNAPNRLTWPSSPTPPEYSVPYQLGTKLDGTPSWTTGTRSRRTALKLGQCSFRWARPSQSRLLKMAPAVKSDI
ncbi:hypothetical protein N7488_004683 [Penicillium malachiteum]|nr:hypothetical protein N7488_004683 [Penicillium malachiteum]